MLTCKICSPFVRNSILNMKYLLLNIFLLFSVFSFAQNPKDDLVSGTFLQMSFTEFVQRIEETTRYRFYFKEEWVKSVEVNNTFRQSSISAVLDELLLPVGLKYVITSNNSVIVLPNKEFVQVLPDYSISSGEQTHVEQDVSSQNDRFLKRRDPEYIKTIVVGTPEKSKPRKQCEIKAFITDEKSGEPLVGATIFIPSINIGAASNDEGECVFYLRPGTYSVTFKCMGKKEAKCNLKVISDGSFNFEMEEDLISIMEVLVQADEIAERGARAGLEMVNISSIKELPTLMGEKNVLQIAQMLPGIVSVGEGSGGINVRGGNADQNLFYVNNVPIYNSTHLFGFFSSVNSDIIDNFNVYKGHVPANYGGRLSSVFNIETRKGNDDQFFMQGGVSPVSAQASIETPIVKQKVSLMLSARSSYSDWILKQLDEPELNNSAASFYDFAGSLNFKLAHNNQLSLFAYNSNDDFTLNEITEFNYSNSGGAINYTNRFNNKLKADVIALGSWYRFSTIDKTLPANSYSHKYELGHYELKAIFDWIPNENHHLKFGTEAKMYDLNRGRIMPYGDTSVKQELDLDSERGLESAMFLDDNLQISSRLALYMGFRYSFFQVLGPKTVLNYTPGAPLEPMYVSDSLVYGKNERIQSFSGPELRLALDYQLRSHNSIKVSLTQMRQYLFLLSNTVSIAPYDQWKLVDSHITPPNSLQLSTGYFHEFGLSGISFSSEVYYKKANHIVEYKDGADFLSTPYVESHILQGKQRAYGAEFMIEKDRGRLNGWLSYTYSRSLITVDGENDFEDINYGEEYPSNYDKPHVLNAILNYKFNKRFSVSSNWAYNTGRPITLPEGVYCIGGQPFVDYSKRNSYRIPDYFRMDLSLKMEGNLKRKKRFHSYWVASVYNLTGRKNENTVFFKSENGVINGYKYSVIGVPVFTLSWNWKLGNYANN